MSNEHPLPWRVEAGYDVIFDVNDRAVFTARYVSRIADCVNACAGMEDPINEIARLKDVWSDVGKADSRLQAISAQRDELLSALKGLDSLTFDSWNVMRFQSELDAARAAIAMCESKG